MHISRYVRHRPDNDVGRYLVGRLIVTADPARRRRDRALDAPVRRLLGDATASGPTDERVPADAEPGDPVAVVRWVESRTRDVASLEFDDGDVFTVNTAHVARVLSLSEAELAILRVALLLRALRALDLAFDFHDDELTERDLCELLARLLELDEDDVIASLHPMGVLRRSGLCAVSGGVGATDCADSWLAVPRRLVRATTHHQEEPGAILYGMLSPVVPPRLGLADFAHVASRVAIVERYLASSLITSRRGVNVLLHGPPGTGKSELARLLVARLDCTAHEVTDDADEQRAVDFVPYGSRRAPAAETRLARYALCQLLSGQDGRGVVVFDEVENILCDAAFDVHGFRGADSLAKQRLNRVLEENAVPSIWITNTVDGADPAFLRRFDLVLHLGRPPLAARQRIARQIFAALPIGEAVLRRIAAREALTPACLEKARKVCAAVVVCETGREARIENAARASATPTNDTGQGTSADASDTNATERLLVEIIDGDLEVLGEPTLSAREGAHDAVARYDATLVNTDVDLERIARRVTPTSSLRLCLYGPSGTGKSAWARHLAHELGVPLHAWQAADVLDAYVGGTEKNVHRAFEMAQAERALLVFDEVDSFLQDRAGAQRHFETTAINQFLTSLEAYTGIVVCTTNRIDALDPATARRFDVTVAFDCLDPARVRRLFGLLLDEFTPPARHPSPAEAVRALAGLALTPGDFAVVRRRAGFCLAEDDSSWRALVRELGRESAARDARTGRAIGFLATRAQPSATP